MGTKFFQNLGSRVKLAIVIGFWASLSIIIFFVGYSLLNKSNESTTKQEIKLEEGKTPPPATEPGSGGDFFLGLKRFFGWDKEEKKEVTEPAKEIQKPEETAVQKGEVPFRSSTWASDYDAMKKNIAYYNEIHPFIYTMKGGLHNTGDLISLWSKQARKERVEEMRALNKDILIIPTIFRWENPKEKIYENIGMGGRNDIRDYHIKKILEEVDTYNYDGIDIDYEGMTCEKKEKFEEFFVLLSKEMKARKKILSVAVHPKTEATKYKDKACKGLAKPILQDFAENWRGPMTHDYAFLAKHADRVKIMAYELHPRKYRNPGPGPQAPNVWIENIIHYAKKRIPTEKLYMAIPTYGYDWALNCNARAKAVYFDDAVRIKAEKAPQHYQPTDIPKIFAENSRSKSWKNLSKFMDIHENKVYEDPSLWYKEGGCDRVAFYMNKKAFEDKMTLLRKYSLGGFSFWQLLSDNDPGINDYLGLLVSNKLPPVEKIDDSQIKTKAEIKEEKDKEKQRLKEARLAEKEAEKLAKEKSTEPKKSEEKTTEEKPSETKVSDEKSGERVSEEKTSEPKKSEEKLAEEKTPEPKKSEEKSSESKKSKKKTLDKKAAEQKSTMLKPIHNRRQ